MFYQVHKLALSAPDDDRVLSTQNGEAQCSLDIGDLKYRNSTLSRILGDFFIATTRRQGPETRLAKATCCLPPVGPALVGGGRSAVGRGARSLAALLEFRSFLLLSLAASKSC